MPSLFDPALHVDSPHSSHDARPTRLLPTELTEYLSKDYIRDHLKGDRKTSYYRWLGGAILSGAISNALSLVLVHPLDLAQTCVQVDLPRERFSGVFDCLSRTASKYGLRALYTGLGVRIASRFLYRSAYFVLYDVTQNALSRDAGQVCCNVTPKSQACSHTRAFHYSAPLAEEKTDHFAPHVTRNRTLKLCFASLSASALPDAGYARLAVHPGLRCDVSCRSRSPPI